MTWRMEWATANPLMKEVIGKNRRSNKKEVALFEKHY
jgi:hypothetical protein